MANLRRTDGNGSECSSSVLGFWKRELTMKLSSVAIAAIAAAIMGSSLSSPAEAKHHRRPVHHHRHVATHQGNCLRFNKTTGTVAGAIGGGLIGNAVGGGTGGTIVGAAAGGLAGHELANNRRKRCN